VPIGAVRLAERHLAHDPPTDAERAALVRRDRRRTSRRSCRRCPRGVTLVASGRHRDSTLAALDLRLRAYDPDRVHGHALAPATVERTWTQRLLAMTTAERRALPGMEAPRADVIAAGAAIFARLAARLAAPAIVVCDRGIRWGLAYALTT
jgi:exopolyphosphatase/guanosine-5'-triphosphate,3'-diphosphate pyrophosphatase